MLSSSMLMMSARLENLRCMASIALEIVTFRACLRPNLSGLVEGEKLLLPLAWLATEEADVWDVANVFILFVLNLFNLFIGFWIGVWNFLRQPEKVVVSRVARFLSGNTTAQWMEIFTENRTAWPCCTSNTNYLCWRKEVHPDKSADDGTNGRVWRCTSPSGSRNQRPCTTV